MFSDVEKKVERNNMLRGVQVQELTPALRESLAIPADVIFVRCRRERKLFQDGHIIA